MLAQFDVKQLIMSYEPRSTSNFFDQQSGVISKYTGRLKCYQDEDMVGRQVFVDIS